MDSSPATWQDTVTAIFTAVTGISAVIILLQFVLARQQLSLTRASSSSAVYQSLLERAEHVGLSRALDDVRRLNYDNYDDFRHNESPDVQDRVRCVVDFFNDVQHLLRDDLLNYESVLHIWTLSVLSCADHLWHAPSWREAEFPPSSWWLNGFREQNKNDKVFDNDDLAEYFYTGFEILCQRIKKSGDPNMENAPWEPDLDRW